MSTPLGPDDEPTIANGPASGPAGDPTWEQPAVGEPTRVQPVAGRPGGPPPPAAPGGPGGSGPGGGGPGGGGPGGGPRQRALLAGAAVVAVAIAIIAAVLASGSGRSKTAASTSTTTAAPAPSTTAAPATTTATVPPTTTTSSTAPAATTTTTTVPPALTPQAALDRIIGTLGPTYAVSPIVNQSGSMWVAVDHPAANPGGGSTVVVDVYRFLAGHWQPQASVPLGADGGTGLLLPASQDATPITIAAVTGSPDPDYAVTTASASSLITTIVSAQTGTWRAVPFKSPNGPVIGVPGANIGQTTIVASFPSCSPTCATGGSQQVTFTYQAGTFVPVSG